ncbi:threonine ammonia-lyase [Desulfatitalea alkaliphila]|uniref:Threonine ammonia-lyase n=1 Tax=Desulfatitalea alkaliphila TaxID=2929485 RepID=A0AA41UQR9_9BACT|nr:threonine ammonia-lyase [Desulfatitalea alkaliphila]MCJ8501643.1 threonine ammonia-lyase [Desulfatitalea alkaliphila]
MPTLEKIEQTSRRIDDHIFRTPLVYSPTLSSQFDAHIYLKLENLQKTGSFKIRGAAAKLVRGCMQNTISAKGVVTASAGNHAQGVALAAREAGLPATVVMPQWSSISKREATRGYGGNIIINGATLEESVARAREIAKEGMTFIHPFDDEDIICGQGTIGLEILSVLPDVETIIVPVGGGGLIAGIGSVIKATNPRIRVIGVEAAACPSARMALRAGKCVSVPAEPSLADGISVKQLGEIPFRMIRKTVDELVTVQEADIAASMQILLDRKKLLAEGAGAAPLAALLNGSVRHRRDEKIVLLVSGGNVDIPLLGRIMRIRLTLSDRPGVLARLLNKVAALEANILHIYHDRSAQRSAIDETRVELELETRNDAHIREIENALKADGYAMEPTDCSGQGAGPTDPPVRV